MIQRDSGPPSGEGYPSYYGAESDDSSLLRTVSLPQILAMLRRHLWLLLVFALAGAGVAVYRIQNAPERYVAAASMRIVNDRRALTAGISEDVAVESNISRAGPARTQLEIVRSS